MFQSQPDKMLLLLLLSVLFRLSTPQCLTASDSLRNFSADSHQSLMQSNLKFSTDLIRTVTLQQPGTNIFISPASVFKAMLLAYFISANQTEINLKQTLRLDENKDKLDIYGGLYLEKYYDTMRINTQNRYQLSNINGLFTDSGVDVEPCMKAFFTDEIMATNFKGNTKKAVKKINKWVSWYTNKFIKDFLPEDSVSSDTRLVLVNAAYFKGTWNSQFPERDTWEGDFHLANGTIVKAQLMTQQNMFRKSIDLQLGCEVLELPYAGDDVSMFLILPNERNSVTMSYILKRLDTRTMQHIIRTTADQEPESIMVTIPKFTFENSLDLAPILESMGAKDLFQRTADLSRLSKSAKYLRFSEAIHTAKIRVDEKGTEAAGATGLLVTRMQRNSFEANRPFIYLLYNKKVDSLLFLGTFYSPPGVTDKI